MQPKNLQRFLRALARQGLDVQYSNGVYPVRWFNPPNAPTAEILLPDL